MRLHRLVLECLFLIHGTPWVPFRPYGFPTILSHWLAASFSPCSASPMSGTTLRETWPPRTSRFQRIMPKRGKSGQSWQYAFLIMELFLASRKSRILKIKWSNITCVNKIHVTTLDSYFSIIWYLWKALTSSFGIWRWETVMSNTERPTGPGRTLLTRDNVSWHKCFRELEGLLLILKCL